MVSLSICWGAWPTGLRTLYYRLYCCIARGYTSPHTFFGKAHFSPPSTTIPALIAHKLQAQTYTFDYYCPFKWQNGTLLIHFGCSPKGISILSQVLLFAFGLISQGAWETRWLFGQSISLSVALRYCFMSCEHCSLYTYNRKKRALSLRRLWNV